MSTSELAPTASGPEPLDGAAAQSASQPVAQPVAQSAGEAAVAPADASESELIPPIESTTIVTPDPQRATAHVQVVDGLRGLAVVLVMLLHYWSLSFYVIPIPFVDKSKYNLEFIQVAGSFGVELFFLISAFCLFYPHAKAMFGQGSVPTLKHFYYRRIIKIIPSYWLALAASYFFFRGLFAYRYGGGWLQDAGLHLIFVHNLLPDSRSTFIPALWSLAVEVQFYYIFPLLAWLFRRWPLRVASGMIVVAMVWRLWGRSFGVPRVFGNDNYYLGWNDFLPAFFDMFAFGMLAAYAVFWLRERPRAVHNLRYVATAIAVLSVVLVGFMFRWNYDGRFVNDPTDWWNDPLEVWRAYNRQWLAALFFLILVASAFSVGAWRRLLSNRVLTFLSTISYNLYIWHVPVGQFIRDHHIYKAKTDPPTSDPQWQWRFTLLGFAVSIALATLITYGFERPLLRRGVRGAVRALVTWPAERLRPNRAVAVEMDGAERA